MNNSQYAHYSVGDFDKYDCLKISYTIYVALIVVLRAYVVWIMSVVNMKDSTATIKLIFPQPELFYLSLLSGCVGLFIAVMLTLRRPNAPSWVVRSWPKTRILLVVALCFDLMINAIGHSVWQLISFNGLLIHSAVATLCVIALYKHQRVILNLKEFPILIEDKK